MDLTLGVTSAKHFDSLTHLPIKRHAYFSGKIAINTFLPNHKLQLRVERV